MEVLDSYRKRIICIFPILPSEIFDGPMEGHQRSDKARCRTDFSRRNRKTSYPAPLPVRFAMQNICGFLAPWHETSARGNESSTAYLRLVAGKSNAHHGEDIRNVRQSCFDSTKRNRLIGPSVRRVLSLRHLQH